MDVSNENVAEMSELQDLVYRFGPYRFDTWDFLYVSRDGVLRKGNAHEKSTVVGMHDGGRAWTIHAGPYFYSG